MRSVVAAAPAAETTISVDMMIIRSHELLLPVYGLDEERGKEDIEVCRRRTRQTLA